MDKNTQQIPHSLSIQTQGQLPGHPVNTGNVQTKAREYTHTHTHDNTNIDWHAHTGTSHCCPLRCMTNAVPIWNKLPSLLFRLHEEGRVGVFFSPTWHTDTDMLRRLCWDDNIMQYIAISRYCTVGNMTFQPSTLAVWLPVVCLPRYTATGCLSPHTAALSSSLHSDTCLQVVILPIMQPYAFITWPEINLHSIF